MPKGRVVRKDEKTSESMKVEAQKKLDRGMLNAITAEDGVLPAGALPTVKANSAAGAQALQAALEDDKNAVAKPKPKKTKREEAENVEPKTVLQWGSPGLLLSK